MTTKTNKPKRRRVYFRVNAPKDAKVYLTGSFNDWDEKKKKLNYDPKEQLFKGTLLLEKGTYEYKFIINGEWCIDPDCQDWNRNEFGSLNSVIYVD